MKLGLIARSDNTGLGAQTWEFYKHMHPVKTMVIDIGKLNGNAQHPERYPDGIFIKGFPTNADVDRFLEGLDVVFLAEAVYNFYLYTRAKELGIKVANQYNYEFFDWIVNPLLPTPDMFIAPSKWHYDTINAWCSDNNIKHTYLHCPVNRELLPKRKITQARIFLHVAGKSAAFDRNGTDNVIDASLYLKTDAKILIHFQGNQGLPHQATNTIEGYKRRLFNHGNPAKVIFQVEELENYADIYAKGDVMILPRRYGGNCLPLNEALSVGMPVIMPDISPNNQFLPPNWLLPATKINEFTPRTVIDIYDVSPVALAAKIDQFYTMSESAMWFENIKADDLAQTISWQALKPEYERVLGELCGTK